jgi:hypothetical protein
MPRIVGCCHGPILCKYKPTALTITKQTIATATQKPDSFIPILCQYLMNRATQISYFGSLTDCAELNVDCPKSPLPSACGLDT